ncbi:uncharacterized protein LOC126742904 [Anthonomus grandis grandis]|uniref:uncharacterized protein LOC126742904 n=1 Tax=Anthonomus grandis grandis TaxID=2921223 RepID=UPI0021655104|nr:uncharacterized protein LOC126742904 [Anthonomus grandis grandis]
MSEKPDTVPGLGFKDKDKALETLQILEGRDPDYQKLAIKGLIGRAKRTLTLTKDKDKLQNINDAMKIFEDWLKDFEFKNLSKENKAYLPLAFVETLLPLKKKYGLGNDLVDSFFKAYKEKAKGEYKNLRTISSGDGEPTWDIIRNRELKKIWTEYEESKPDFWGSDDLPTKEHLQLILWAYSPEASKIKKNISNYEEKLQNMKTKANSDSDNGSKDKDSKKGTKRKSEGSGSGSSSSGSSNGSESDEESPKKKSKK